MGYRVGDADTLINPAIATGLQHYLCIGSAFGDAVLRVAAWSHKKQGWQIMGEPDEKAGEARVRIRQAADDISLLFDNRDIRKVSVQVLEGDNLVVVAAEFIPTPLPVKA